MLITKDGQVYRGIPEDDIDAHCFEHNSYTLGICVKESYMKETMPMVQKKAFIDLYKYLCEKYKIKTIKWHNELVNTNCSSTNFLLNEIREVVLSSEKKLDIYKKI